MHLYLITRGIKHDVDRFIREMTSKYVPYKFYNKDTGKIEMGGVQVAMRPVQFWEVIFPEETRDTILNTLWPQDRKEVCKGHFGNIATRKFKWILDRIRKLLGAEPIPEDYKNVTHLPLYMHNVEFIGVGIKKDARNKDGIERL